MGHNTQDLTLADWLTHLISLTCRMASIQPPSEGPQLPPLSTQIPSSKGEGGAEETTIKLSWPILFEDSFLG